MFRKIWFVLFAGIFVFVASGISFAQETQADTQVSVQAVDVGNKICPVSGEKIDEKATYEYQGKIYNFCCSSCVEDFKKDPGKYIKKVDEELKAKDSKELKKMKMSEEDEMPMGMQGHEEQHHN